MAKVEQKACQQTNWLIVFLEWLTKGSLRVNMFVLTWPTTRMPRPRLLRMLLSTAPCFSASDPYAKSFRSVLQMLSELESQLNIGSLQRQKDLNHVRFIMADRATRLWRQKFRRQQTTANSQPLNYYAVKSRRVDTWGGGLWLFPSPNLISAPRPKQTAFLLRRWTNFFFWQT